MGERGDGGGGAGGIVGWGGAGHNVRELLEPAGGAGGRGGGGVNRGSTPRPATRIHPAVSTCKHRIHPNEAHWFNPTNGLTSRSIPSTLVRCAKPRKQFHLWKCDHVWKFDPASWSPRRHLFVAESRAGIATSAKPASARPWFARAGGGRDKAPAA